MMRFVTGRALWRWITHFGRRSNGRRLVAVPYVGSGGAGLVHLTRGDVLVTSLTEANARAGLIDPREIRQLQRKGVRIYTRPDLHAKVYLLGRLALVASANLSKHSKDFLEEAGLIVGHGPTAAVIRQWFGTLMAQPVTPSILRRCLSVYRPAPFPQERHETNGLKKSRPRRKGSTAPPQRVWLVTFDWLDFPRGELAEERKGDAIARMRMGRKRGYEIVPWRFTNQDKFIGRLERDHRFIPVELGDNGPEWVHPHEIVHEVRRVKTRRGTAYHVHVEAFKHYRRIRWVRFRRQVNKIGLHVRGRQPGIQEIRDPVIAQQALQLVTPKQGT